MSSRSSSSKQSIQREKPQISTAISDAVLAFLTLYSVSLLMASAAGNYRHSSRTQPIAVLQYVASFGIGLTGVAAGVGALRYAGFTALKTLHEFTAGAAMFMSMQMLGVVAIFAFVHKSGNQEMFLIVGALLFVIFLLFRQFPRKLQKYQDDYIRLSSLFGIMCLFFRCLPMLIGKSGSGSKEAVSAGWNGVYATVCILIAAAVSTTGTRKFGPVTVLNVDIFHYFFAIANICLVHLFQGMWM